MKKLLSLLLALIMLVSLAVPAFAETDEYYEEFTFNFGVPYGYNATIEGEKINIEANRYFETTIIGGRTNHATKIYVKEGNDIVITRVEARVCSYPDDYGKIGVKPGEKREENIGRYEIAHIDNINSKEFAFDGGTDFVAFDLVRVYYECAGEHTWGENGICGVCGVSNCNITGEHTWNGNGICGACGARKCDVIGEHTWNKSGICGACGARKCDVTGEHTWNKSGICGACSALKCDVTGEHPWDENGKCEICGRPKCKVVGEHNGISICAYCGKELSEEVVSSGNGTASTLSEGNISMIVGIACAAVFGLGGYLLGSKEKV